MFPTIPPRASRLHESNANHPHILELRVACQFQTPPWRLPYSRALKARSLNSRGRTRHLFSPQSRTIWRLRRQLRSDAALAFLVTHGDVVCAWPGPVRGGVLKQCERFFSIFGELVLKIIPSVARSLGNGRIGQMRRLVSFFEFISRETTKVIYTSQIARGFVAAELLGFFVPFNRFTNIFPRPKTTFEASTQRLHRFWISFHRRFFVRLLRSPGDAFGFPRVASQTPDA